MHFISKHSVTLSTLCVQNSDVAGLFHIGGVDAHTVYKEVETFANWLQRFTACAQIVSPAPLCTKHFHRNGGNTMKFTKVLS